MKATIFGREPVVIVAAVNAIVGLVVGFGLDVSGEQQALIQTAVTAVLAVLARAKVTPNPNVAVTVADLEHESWLP